LKLLYIQSKCGNNSFRLFFVGKYEGKRL